MAVHARLSIGVPNFGSWFGDAPWSRLVELAAEAESCGVDRLVVVDHVVMGPNPGAYRWGRFPTASDGDWLEPLTVLTAMAAVTWRVRLATGIMIPALRGAAALAKTAATLDVLSAGRLELGVGIGWQREEYEAAGLDWSQRGQLLDDTLAACEVLWREAPASFTSSTVSFDEVWCRPAPVQSGPSGGAGIPVLVAGTLAPRNLARLVRHGMGWIPIMGASAAEVGEGVATIQQAFADAGRDPRGLLVQRSVPVVRHEGGARDGVPDLAATFAPVRSWSPDVRWAVHLSIQALCTTVDDAGAVLEAAADELHAASL